MQPLRQCAWCWRVLDSFTGLYSAMPFRKINTATHGICPPCKEQVRAEIENMLPLAA